jgi:hypothetical protein
VSLIAQKSRYPRSSSSVQSANSSQNANRPSSRKRKMSSLASYKKSEAPFSMKYLSTSHRSWGWRLIAAPWRCSAGLLSSWPMASVLCVLAEQKIPQVRRVLERGPHSSRPKTAFGPGPRVMASSEGSTRGARPGQSSKHTGKAHVPVQWYAGCSRETYHQKEPSD